jgi:hypothetical protein
MSADTDGAIADQARLTGPLTPDVAEIFVLVFF